MRRRYLTPEVAANFIKTSKSTSAEILPASFDFIVENFNHHLKTTLDTVVPLLTKTITSPQPIGEIMTSRN